MKTLSIFTGLLVVLPASSAWTQADFVRGDADQNGELGLGDVAAILYSNFLELGLRCLAAGDADGNGEVQLTDAVRILNHLYLGQGEIPAPFPAPGPGGPTDMSCASYVTVPPASDERVPS